MIKFTATQPGGRTMLGLGITAKNVEMLMNGRPIRIVGSKIGVPIDVLIFYGTDERLMVKQLREAGVELPTPQVSPPGADNHDG